MIKMVKVFKAPNSNVPKNLRESFYQEKQNFFNDFFSYIQETGKLVWSFSDCTNNTVTLYTVPTGKVFYLFHVQIDFSSANIAANTTSEFLLDGTAVLRLRTLGSTNQTEAVSFSIPIKVKEGKTLQLRSSGLDVVTDGGFSGIEIDASVIPFYELVIKK